MWAERARGDRHRRAQALVALVALVAALALAREAVGAPAVPTPARPVVAPTIPLAPTVPGEVVPRAGRDGADEAIAIGRARRLSGTIALGLGGALLVPGCLLFRRGSPWGVVLLAIVPISVILGVALRFSTHTNFPPGALASAWPG